MLVLWCTGRATTEGGRPVNNYSREEYNAESAYFAIASSIFVCFFFPSDFFPRLAAEAEPVSALRFSPVFGLSDAWLEPEAARRADDRVPAIVLGLRAN